MTIVRRFFAGLIALLLVVLPVSAQSTNPVAGYQGFVNQNIVQNGKGKITGPILNQAFSLLSPIFNSQGTWNPQGVYTPSIGGLPPAPSATIDTTNSANITTRVSPGSAYRSLNDYLRDHISVKSYGAVCDGNTNDYMALATAFSLASNGGVYHVEMPPVASCAFDPAPFGAKTLTINLPYGSIDGGDQYGTRLLYNGPSSSNDLVTVGVPYLGTNANGTPVNSGLTSGGETQIKNTTFDSANKQTGGAALHLLDTQFISLENVSFTRPGGANNLYTAMYADQTDTVRLHNFYMQAQADCLAFGGNGAEPRANNGTGGATGPQYDLWADFGRINQCNVGIHAGGGFDGGYFDHIQVTNNNYDVVIDNALKPHPNQEIIFGSEAFLDFANYDNVLINDPLANQSIMALASFAGPVLHAGGNGTTGVAGTINAGQPAPANSGNLFHVKSYPDGYLMISSPYLHRAVNAAIFDEDQTAYLSVARHTIVGGVPGGTLGSATSPLMPFGIEATASWSRVLSLPQFVAVNAPLTNVTKPDVIGNNGIFDGALSSGGHTYCAGGFAPITFTSTGTATPSNGISDCEGTLTASAALSVVLAFHFAFANPPVCIVSSSNGPKPIWTTQGGAGGVANGSGANLVITTTQAEIVSYICRGS